MFCKNSVPKYFAKLKGKHPCRNLFSSKAADINLTLIVLQLLRQLEQLQKPKLATQNTVIALDQNYFKSFAVENSEGDR